MNNVLQYVFENPIKIAIPKLDVEPLWVVFLSDASFANNRYNSTQLGFIVLIVDKFNKSVLVFFKSYKALVIVHSIPGVELIASSGMFDLTVSLDNKLNRMHAWYKIPVCLLKKNKSFPTSYRNVWGHLSFTWFCIQQQLWKHLERMKCRILDWFILGTTLRTAWTNECLWPLSGHT